jgi:beta-lactamase superfamily II metal-dependent hydrolase
MELKVSFLNIGEHGDCSVIIFDEKDRKACIVIDGGEFTKSATALETFLENENIRTIDLMIGTHIDQDHINGLYRFVMEQREKEREDKPSIGINEYWGPLPSAVYINNVQPTEVSDPRVSKEPRESADSWHDYVAKSIGQNNDLYSELAKMKVPIKHPALNNLPVNPFENISLEILGPDTQIPADTIKGAKSGFTVRKSGGMKIKSLDDLKAALAVNRKELAIAANRNANNQSIVVKLTPNAGGDSDWSFLFTGDAEHEAWEEMTDNPDISKKLASKVLKIPHHGSHQNGITERGAECVKPEYSVNLVGQKHGLPDKETMVILHKLGSRILCPQRNNNPKEEDRSDCFPVSGNECPALGNAETVTFLIDTDNEGNNLIPAGRSCAHDWK